MHVSVVPMRRTLDLNTRLFMNCLEGMSDEQALERIGAKTNNAAFVAAHLVESRHFLAGAVGLESESPFKEALSNAKSLEDVKELPSLDAIRAAWSDVSKALAEHLETLDDDALAAKAPFAFPIDGGDTVLGCLTFLTQHDTYHLGQLALLRRQLGLEAMSYS